MSERTLRVLLVDDEELVRGAVRDWLEDEQFVITEAASGAEALALLAGEAFDCCILDLHLPDMTGTQVLAAARQAGSTSAWLVMTGRLDIETVQELHGLGVAAEAILVKPILDMQQISHTIHLLIAP